MCGSIPTRLMASLKCQPSTCCNCAAWIAADLTLEALGRRAGLGMALFLALWLPFQSGLIDGLAPRGGIWPDLGFRATITMNAAPQTRPLARIRNWLVTAFIAAPLPCPAAIVSRGRTLCKAHEARLCANGAQTRL